MPVNLRAAVAVLFFVALAVPLEAQSTSDAIKARLRNRPLYIRGFWSDDTLQFDGNGDLTTPAKRSTFTLDGFTFASVKLKNGLLTLFGRVVGVEFRDDKPERVSLSYPQRIIRITAPKDGDFGPALDAIFADGIEALAPSLPEYWQKWARKTYPAAYTSEASGKFSLSDSAVEKIGGAVSPPTLLHGSDTTPTVDSMALRYSGRSLIDVVLRPDGKPSDLSIVKPLGLGLDERALAAVQRYSFAPAMRGDKPVSVEIMVDFKFDSW